MTCAGWLGLALFVMPLVIVAALACYFAGRNKR